MNAHIDDHEPQDLHPLSCAIWETSDQPCDCHDTSRRPTTAQRLDQLALATVWDIDAEAARYFGGQGR